MGIFGEGEVRIDQEPNGWSRNGHFLAKSDQILATPTWYFSPGLQMSPLVEEVDVMNDKEFKRVFKAGIVIGEVHDGAYEVAEQTFSDLEKAEEAAEILAKEFASAPEKLDLKTIEFNEDSWQEPEALSNQEVLETSAGHETK